MGSSSLWGAQPIHQREQRGNAPLATGQIRRGGDRQVRGLCYLMYEETHLTDYLTRLVNKAKSDEFLKLHWLPVTSPLASLGCVALPPNY
ncbi:MAG: hypothetical protein GY820_25730 [Gammaproteobacteria bacterium]|nr:hypothetical protein [Gammaproteobacteria bacterium]